MAVRLDCDLSFDCSGPAGSTTGADARLSGSVRASGSEVILTVDALPGLGGASTRSLRSLSRQLAGVLNHEGLSLRVRTAAGDLLVVGHGVRGGLLTRLITGSSRIKIIAWSGVVGAVRGKALGVPLSSLLPPRTPLPFAPTFQRRLHSVRTTHDPAGGGRPRLYFAAPLDYPGEPPRVFSLPPSDAVLGAAPTCQLSLPGLRDQHALIRRTAGDEYTIEPAVVGADVRVAGALITGPTVLRTGTRVELSGWRMSYFREEFADHGRPYGGRIGGEAGYQRSQDRPKFRS